MVAGTVFIGSAPRSTIRQPAGAPTVWGPAQPGGVIAKNSGALLARNHIEPYMQSNI
jgi:hypothetical protein